MFPKEKEGNKKFKPWTHVSGPSGKIPEEQKLTFPSAPGPKRRPVQQKPIPPPTPETTIEQAAIWVCFSAGYFNSPVWRIDPINSSTFFSIWIYIWSQSCNNFQASTELIDAIREALQKFRETLTEANNAVTDDADRQRIADDVNQQLQQAWSTIKSIKLLYNIITKL